MREVWGIQDTVSNRRTNSHHIGRAMPLASKLKHSRREPPSSTPIASLLTLTAKPRPFPPAWSPSIPSLTPTAALSLTVLFPPLTWGPDLGGFAHWSFLCAIVGSHSRLGLDAPDHVRNVDVVDEHIVPGELTISIRNPRRKWGEPQSLRKMASPCYQTCEGHS